MKPINRYITIEGNIGSGKTTLAELLSHRLQYQLLLETFENNPFLPKFYEEPQRYAMPVELFFLCERAEHLKLMDDAPRVADYSLIKSLIFAEVTLPHEEFLLYQRIFHIANPTIPKADITIYLNHTVDRLLQNIKHRGRPYEQNIPPSYLASVEASYLEFYRKEFDGPVLMVNCDQLDFLTKATDLELLLSALEISYPPGIHYFNP